MFINEQTGELTTVLGTKSVNITAMPSILKQFYISPATSTTTYDVKLIDTNNITVLSRENETGELNELIELPTFGNFTLTVDNASKNEKFTYTLKFKE